MRILIDILHPAHVHFFRHFHREMSRRGHQIHITARVKECSTDLLERFQLEHTVISRQRAGVRLAGELIQRTYRLASIARNFRPDVMTGIMGPSIAIAGALLRIPAVVFYDTEFAVQTNWFTYPLAHSVCTPDCYRGRVRGTHVTYPGYHELAYLHPNRFAADGEQVRAFGLEPQERFSIVRFVSWGAVHDRRERGLTVEQKLRLVESLGRFGRVLISSEGPLPADLQPLKLVGPVERIHHLVAHAQLVVGESATMASEAAVLGVPAIFIATSGRGYTDDQEKRYGLVRYFPEDRFDEALGAIEELVSSGSPRTHGSSARERMLAEKIDVTGWMIDYFEARFGG
jgi:predicted glycosyltransferase